MLATWPVTSTTPCWRSCRRLVALTPPVLPTTSRNSRTRAATHVMSGVNEWCSHNQPWHLNISFFKESIKNLCSCYLLKNWSSRSQWNWIYRSLCQLLNLFQSILIQFSSFKIQVYFQIIINVYTVSDSECWHIIYCLRVRLYIPVLGLL